MSGCNQNCDQGRHCVCAPAYQTTTTYSPKLDNMTNYTIKTAGWPILPIMNLLGFEGWTSFWNTIYFAPGKKTPELLRHEVKHLEQINRDGIFKFSIKYTYYTLRYGYYNNLYEVEARIAQHTE